MRLLSLVLSAAMAAASCQATPPPREYHVVGQILAIDRTTSRVTIRHSDIVGFMPAMTMPFPVKDAALLDGHEPGELVDATLLVTGTDAWISRIAVTGHAPLPPAGAMPMPGLGPGDQVADAAFVDDLGRPLHIAQLGGHPALITFIYTRCPLPQFCPAIESKLVGLQAAIKREPSLRGTRIVSITIDPAHDSAAVLKVRAAERGADAAVWLYATGAAADIDAFGRQFGLAVTRTTEEPTGIEHNLRTVILDRDRRIVQVLTGSDWEIGDAVRALEQGAERP